MTRVAMFLQLREQGLTQVQIAKRYGLSRQRVWQLLNPVKARAQGLVAEARAAGKLRRPRCCEACGKSCKVESHHPDHNEAFAIQWLCPQCHRNADQQLRAPLIAVRQQLRRERHQALNAQRREARRERSKLRYRERWHRALEVLKQLSRNGVGPTYATLASHVMGRPIKHYAGCPALAGWLGRFPSLKTRYWLRVQALYRLAGVQVRRPGRPVGARGHKEN